MAIEIIWSAVLQKADAPSVTRRTTQLLSLLPPEPAEAAATALKWWLEDHDPDQMGTNWEAEAGDENKVTGIVVIHDPPEFAGCYDVEIERVLQASGSTAADDDAQRVRDLLAEHEAI